MRAIVPVLMGILGVAVICLGFVVIGLIRQVDDLDRRVAQLGMAMPGKAGRLGLKVGSLAPEIRGRTLGRAPFVQRDWTGIEHLVVFAHPGCPPCEDLVPGLVDGVSRGAIPPTIIVSEGSIEDHPVEWRRAADSDPRLTVIVQDRSSMARRFQTFVTPHLFVLAGDGRVAAQGIASTLDEVNALFRKAHRRAGRTVMSSSSIEGT